MIYRCLGGLIAEPLPSFSFSFSRLARSSSRKWPFRYTSTLLHFATVTNNGHAPSSVIDFISVVCRNHFSRDIISRGIIAKDRRIRGKNLMILIILVVANISYNFKDWIGEGNIDYRVVQVQSLAGVIFFAINCFTVILQIISIQS